MKDAYDLIFKRKSFHLFRGAQPIPLDTFAHLKQFITSVRPLDPTIRTEIRIVPEAETTCHRGAQFCLLFYSEKAENALANIGYIGEQIDLFCAGENIGALWAGIGRPKEEAPAGMDYVILMEIAAMPEDTFRRDMFRARRKPLDEIWQGETLGVGEIVRFAPSACNSQPWMTENDGEALTVYRCRKPGRIGIMPADKAAYYNRIDMGIYLQLLEVCLAHEGIAFERTLYGDAGDAFGKLPTARYAITKKAEPPVSAQRKEDK